MKKKVVSIMLCAALAVGMTACGSDSDSSTADAAEETEETEEAEEAEEAEETEEAAETTSSAGGSAYIDEVNVAVPYDLSDLSPWANNSQGRSYTATTIYESLITSNNEGETIPLLAESWETEDGYTYTFHLYDYIHDTQGNPITASDVVFSFDQCVAGGQQMGIMNVESCTEVDDYTVEIKMSETSGIGDLENALMNFFIVSEAAYEASPDNMVTTPVGTSHYEVTDFISGSSLTLVDTQDYWQTDELTAPRSVANVNTINYYILTESSQRTVALQNGSVDAAEIADTDRASFEGSSDYNVDDILNATVYNISPNCSEESLMSDINLRLAVFYAVDNAGMAAGYDVAAGDAVNSPGSPYYVDYYADYVDAAAESNYYSYDKEKAEEYLAESDYDGSTLKIVSMSDQGYINLATVLQGYLKEIGIDSDIETYEMSVYNEALADPTNWDISLGGFQGDVSWVNITEKGFNPAKYDNDGATGNFILDDTLIDMMNTVRNVNTYSEETVKEYFDYITDNAYYYGIFAPITTTVTTSKFNGDFVYQPTEKEVYCYNACGYNAD